MKKVLVCLLIIYSIVLLGCPAKKNLETAKKYSAKLAGISKGTAEITLTLYNKGKISFEQKNKIADAFIKLSDAGIRFDQVIQVLEAKYDEAPPKTEIDNLFILFDDEVVALFLEAVDAVTGLNISEFSTTIKKIKNIILTISEVFGPDKHQAIRLKVAAI